jgi:hypothetical protein
MWCDVVVNNTRLRYSTCICKPRGCHGNEGKLSRSFIGTKYDEEKKNKVFKETFDLLLDGIHKRIVQADNLHRLVEESPYPYWYVVTLMMFRHLIRLEWQEGS